MIERLQAFPENVVAFACHGHVAKSDYATVLIPAVEEALAQHQRVRLYYEIAGDFAGIDPAAVWQDTKLGIGHLSRWEKLAVVTDVEWIKHTMTFFAFLLPAEMRVFPRAEAAKAREWIISD